GDEVRVITLQDPALRQDAYRTTENFAPGLVALAEDRGDEEVITQAMVNQLRDLWQAIAEQASPQLAETINQELGRYNDFQDFVGLNFDQWVDLLLGRGGGGFRLYLPVVLYTSSE
ncbi:MAG TPA: hypothetical protein VER55_06310, partial [Ardenticatenaceae bacterium]|nr:hypothetical protein [Ardenticatenaceae bacterium]